ncbi:Calx-beta domain-containing protein [Dawidia soli]|uniref:Calx-beta domain-containing protein n=1 Tax=Dawidia soli TaxID=2782352 RepID=A0AAP2DCR7_9BACT|nr:Calx-beta domain-containing protein [Dawidia soli]MBT1689624.1 hypothetical protein [Dawidia soli]
MKKLYSRYISILGLAAAFAACSDDDQTGDSILTPTAPTVNITIDHPEVTMLEKDSTFTFTVTLSTPQIVDVAVYVNVTGGDATEGEDFTYTSLLKIPANRTSASGQVKILADDLPEDSETLTITIGDAQTENATITPRTMSFTIQNVSSGDLPLTLSWNGTLFDATGAPIDPDDIADMILYITDLDGNVLETIDGASYEEFLMSSDFEDGEYLVKAGVFAVINTGGLGAVPLLDLSLEYSQAGVMEPAVLEFPASFDPNILCGTNMYTLAKIVKTGTSYEVTRLGEAPVRDISEYVGSYDAEEPGYDGSPYPVNFTQGATKGILINDNFWDAAVSVEYHADLCDAGVITIPEQTFEVGGTAYTVTGSGEYSGGNTIVVEYTVTNAAGQTLDHNTHTFTKN